mgnify:CR=1 FL=1
MRKLVVTAAAAVVGGSILVAGPAYAQTLEGTYDSSVTGGGPIGTPAKWEFVPCGSGCAREVSSNRGEFHLTGTTWAAVNGACSVGIDANTLAGGIACPPHPVMTFQLTRAG